jgi:hypothetical protein
MRMMANWTDPDPSSGAKRGHCLIPIDLNSKEADEVRDTLFRSINKGSTKLLRKLGNADPQDKEGNYAIHYVPEEIKNDAGNLDVTEILRVQKATDIGRCDLYVQQAGEWKGGVEHVKVMDVYHGTKSTIANDIVMHGIAGFDRSQTHSKAFGDGTYFGLPQVSIYHAIKDSPDKRTGCLMASQLYYTKIGCTKNSNRLPRDCDCGGSGTDENAWIYTAVNDLQARPVHLIMFTWKGKQYWPR